MELIRIVNEPKAIVKFTSEEVRELVNLSERHYDAKCRSLSKNGGVLYGLNNLLAHYEFGEKVGEYETVESFPMTLDTVDLLCKICEQGNGTLSGSMWLRFVAIFNLLNKPTEATCATES
jgi:hypothetical protein